jgi:hypothetical protein
MAKNDKDRSAAFRAQQRRKAAEEKAEKERAARSEASGLSVGPYHFGGYVSSGTYQFNTFGLTPSDLALDTALDTAAATECFVGYRMWPLKRTYPAGYLLTAANSQFDGTVTPNQKLTAGCKKHVYDGGHYITAWNGISPSSSASEPTHEAPAAGCLCGIYAYKNAVQLDHSDKPYAAGEVYLWGRIIEHETGYRAEFAYPKRLTIVDGGAQASRIADALSLAYGVPCDEWFA